MIFMKNLFSFCINVKCVKRRICTQSQAYSHDREDRHEKIKLEKEFNLYDEHIPTTALQKIILTVGSSILAITDPFRYDMVAVLGETTGTNAARKIRDKMFKDPEASVILRDKPRINSSTLNYNFLESLPVGTFGHTYIQFLKDNNVTPDTRTPVQFVDDAEVAYIIQRYREVHDLTHALLGMPTTMLGEVAVKLVEASQTGLPMCISAAIFGPIRFRPKQRRKYLQVYLPWALDCASKSKFILNVYFEKRWQQNTSDLRKELNIPDPPEYL